MELIYLLVPFSLVFSIGFLLAFFWAVDNDQFESIYSAPYNILDDNEAPKGESRDE